jgi:hypothetical protein
MNDTTQARLDAQLLAELRQWRLSPSVTAAAQTKPDAFLSWEEIDMLLRIAEERDALRRQLADMPDERPTNTVEIPSGHALVDGKLVPVDDAERHVREELTRRSVVFNRRMAGCCEGCGRGRDRCECGEPTA